MAVSKLANSVKQEILRLYCETDATTTQLAKQFGISSSTVLRLLQDMMSPEDYREIVAQKNQMKGRRKSKSDAVSDEPQALAEQPPVLLHESAPKRSATKTKAKTGLVQLPLEVEAYPANGDHNLGQNNLTQNLVRVFPQETSQQIPQNISLEEAVEEIADEIADELSYLPHVDNDLAVELDKIDEMVGDDFGDEDDELPQPLTSTLHLDDDLDDLESDPDDEELEDLEDAEDLDDFDESVELDIANLGGAYLTGRQRQEIITILPLNEAELPLTCYMVVDKAAEIVTRPLREFQDLGMIPDEENSSRTVPVFGNHRVARRFSNHNQRVIKFPGDLIYATQDHLVKKGITRLFFDGNVYSLN